MLNCFVPEPQGLTRLDPPPAVIPEHCLWVDLLEPTLEEERAVEQFLASDITWLDELYAMAKWLPPADDAIFTQLILSTRQPAGAQIVLDGYTREAEQLSALRDSLRADGRSVNSTGNADDAKRKDYNWRFQETVSLTKTISLEKSSARPAAGAADASGTTSETPVGLEPADAEAEQESAAQ